MTNHAPLSALVRAQMDRTAAHDLVSSLASAGWRGAGIRVPADGPPEVSFPLTGLRPGMRRLVTSLPAHMEGWCRRNGVDTYELTIINGADRSAHRVVAGDLRYDAMRALVEGITAVIARDGAGPRRADANR